MDVAPPPAEAHEKQEELKEEAYVGTVTGEDTEMEDVKQEAPVNVVTEETIDVQRQDASRADVKRAEQPQQRMENANLEPVMAMEEPKMIESIKQEDHERVFPKDPISQMTSAVESNIGHLKEVPSTIPAPAASAIQESSRPQKGAGSGTSNPAVAKIQSRPISRAGSVAPHNGGSSSNTTTGAPTRVYLKEQINDWLLEGMRWLVFARPENGLQALAQYLQSADAWRNEAAHAEKEPASFQKYWNQYQVWKEQQGGERSEADYKATL